MLCGLGLTSGKVILNSDGKAWRPHLHIEDVCRAIKCSLDWNPCNGELNIFNVGNDDDNYQIIDIAKLIHYEINGSQLTYLDKEKDDKGYINDRKIQDGVDTRTYKVSFEKIHNHLPGFTCKWNVESGIKDLISQLEHVGLTGETFSKRDFYRLQQIEYLHSCGQINDDLFWVK